MGPEIKEINVKKILLHSKTINNIEITEVNIDILILRPVMKKIIFITKEFDKVIVYDDTVTPGSFEAHEHDSDDALIDALLVKIDSTF